MLHARGAARATTIVALRAQDVSRDRRAARREAIRRGRSSSCSRRRRSRASVGVSAVRLDGAHEHRDRPGRRRRGRSHSRHRTRRIARQDRLQRPLRRISIRASAAQIAVCRSGAQRRLHRRAADGDHEQPQLRQPEAARGLLPVPRGGRGMGEACDALGTPVTGGNVSLYNENPRGAVLPDAGRSAWSASIESLAHITRAHFQHDGDAIVLLGEPTARARRQRVSRAHSRRRRRRAAAVRPRRRERALIDALLEAIQRRRGPSAHDCSDGGLAVALAECCIADRDAQLGARRSICRHWRELPTARAAVRRGAGARRRLDRHAGHACSRSRSKHGVPARRIGTVRRRSAALHDSRWRHALESRPLDTARATRITTRFRDHGRSATPERTAARQQSSTTV